MRRRLAWTSLPDEQILQLRFKDLKVAVEGTWLKGCIADLHDELDQRGLRLKPHAWLSDEWFSPDNTPGIAIPFYLAHPRLMRIERKEIGSVEGGTVPECRRILRHETGHVLQHAHQLHRRRRWSELFGRSSVHYPKHYRPNPASKDYVQHLPHWYGQSHPDEDFAETFAVWLAPRSGWRTRYAGWPALEKLEYVDELMAEVAAETPVLARRFKVDPLSRLTETLDEHYEKKRNRYAVDTPRTYDKDLRRIFSDDRRHHGSPPASAFLRHNRGKIRQMVSRWAGEHQGALDTVLDDMIARCRELKLHAAGSERRLRSDFTGLLTTETTRLRYSPSRRKWFAL